MKIKRLHFKNGYKRFHDLTIDLGNDPKRIIALVGPNGSGKSSVFDGLLYASYYQFKRIGNKNVRDRDYHSANGEQYDPDDIEIALVDGLFNELILSNNQKNTVFSFRSAHRFNRNIKLNKIQSVEPIDENTYGPSSTSDVDDKMVNNYGHLYAMYNKMLNTRDLRPSVARKELIDELNLSLEKCLDLTIVDIGNIESGRGTLYFTKPDQSRPFEFNVLSAGEKEVVDLLLDIYLRKESFSESIYLIDEPELHINTSIQRKLLHEINRLVGANSQIWIATHSIGFIRALQDDFREDSQVIFFDPKLNFGSDVVVLEPIKSSRSEWKNIFSTALGDLVDLVSPERIIYCEGIGHTNTLGLEQGFDATVFNNIFSKKYPDTLFVSSGGNTELDQRSSVAISILSKVFKDVEILVLKDRDLGSGKLVKQSDRLQYLKENPDYHRVLVRWEIENYLFDKEVLVKYCVENTLLFDEVAYDRYVTNIDDQDIKNNVGYIKNFCNIKTNINPDKFKINLSKVISENMTIYKELESCIFAKNSNQNKK